MEDIYSNDPRFNPTESKRIIEGALDNRDLSVVKIAPKFKVKTAY